MTGFFCIKLELLKHIYGVKRVISFIDKNGAPIGNGLQKFRLYKANGSNFFNKKSYFDCFIV